MPSWQKAESKEIKLHLLVVGGGEFVFAAESEPVIVREWLNSEGELYTNLCHAICSLSPGFISLSAPSTLVYLSIAITGA